MPYPCCCRAGGPNCSGWVSANAELPSSGWAGACPASGATPDYMYADNEGLVIDACYDHYEIISSQPVRLIVRENPSTGDWQIDLIVSTSGFTPVSSWRATGSGFLPLDTPIILPRSTGLIPNSCIPALVCSTCSSVDADIIFNS